MRTCEGWYCLRGAVWEAEEGIYYWYRYPWPVGREDLLVLYSLRLRKDNKIKIIIRHPLMLSRINIIIRILITDP